MKNKKNKTDTPVVTTAVSTDDEVAMLQKQLDEQKARLRAAKEKQENEAKARAEKLNSQLATLHDSVDGVDSPEELLNALKTMLKPKSTRKGGGKSIPAEKVTQIVEDIKAGMTGAAVSEKYSVSAPTISKIRKNHDLVGKGGRRAA